MRDLHISAEFTFLDKCGNTVKGKVSGLKTDSPFDEIKTLAEEVDKVNFARKYAEDYLKDVLGVDFNICYMIALLEGEL